VYRIGDFVDLCTGPHFDHTGRAQGFQIIKNSASYWLANADNESLQRVYGISFPEKSELAKYQK
jgi:threonyl-tRNA synthetase